MLPTRRSVKPIGGAHSIFVGLVALVTMAGCVQTPDGASSAPLRLGVIGDQTGTLDLDRSYAELEKGVAQLQGAGLDAVIHLGDLVESAKPLDAMAADYGRATALLDQLGVPWFLTAGDHDVNPPGRETNAQDRSREGAFLDLYGQRNTALGDRPYYVVHVDGWQLISLFSHDQLHADPRWGNIFFARISDDQFDWLEQTLRTGRKARKGTIVFIHQPLWYNWGDWARVHGLLAAHDVRLVIAGHFHYSQDEGTLDGVRYLVHGATGGRIKGTPPAFGGAHLVSIIEVSQTGLSLRSLTTDGEALPGFPQRRVMDRLQSLDVALGMLSSSLGRFAVYREADGALTGHCGTDEPGAQIPLSEFANPIDRPLRISLSLYDEPDVAISVSSSDCLHDPSAFSPASALSCTLPAGRGAVVSNLASVRFSPVGAETPVISVNGSTTRNVLQMTVSVQAEVDGTRVEANDVISVPVTGC